MKNYDPALVAMAHAATTTGVMLLNEQDRAEAIEQTYKDFVTKQDEKAETMIAEQLRVYDPGIPFFGEETGGEFIRKGRVWVVDPIDGTLQYFKGKQEWGVSIALVENGIAVAGAIYIPAKYELFVASVDSETMRTYHNQGITAPPHVSQKKNVLKCDILASPGKTGYVPFAPILDKLARAKIYTQDKICCITSLTAVATGEAGAFIFKPDHFDAAAGGLIVRQAGGRVTDLEGNEWTPFSKSILATNGLIHDELLDILKTPD